MKMTSIIQAALAAILIFGCGTVEASSPSSTDNLINPFVKSVGDFPFVKMTYGYETGGLMKGFMVEEDSVYSYTKAGGHKEPAKHLVPFEYFTEVKVDGRGDRALQTLYTDKSKQEMVHSINLDFRNARSSYFTEDQYQC